MIVEMKKIILANNLDNAMGLQLFIRIKVTVYIIEAERVNFLLGKESIMDLDIMLHCPGHRIVFKEKGKKVETVESKDGHSVVNLELVGKWKKQ